MVNINKQYSQLIDLLKDVNQAADTDHLSDLNGKKVSIVVPVYNEKERLWYSIGSIMAQTYKNIEIILIDDGSDDGSSEYCDELAEFDTRIKVIHKSNGGVASARNCGIELSSGDFLLFVDADDYIHYQFIELLLSILSKNDADLIFGDFIRHTEFESNCFLSNITENRFEAVDHISFLHDSHRYFVWGILFSKHMVQNIRFRENLNMGEDSSFMLELICNEKPNIIYAPNAHYYYVQHEHSWLHSHNFCEYQKKAIKEFMNIYYEMEKCNEKIALGELIIKEFLSLNVESEFVSKLKLVDLNVFRGGCPMTA